MHVSSSGLAMVSSQPIVRGGSNHSWLQLAEAATRRSMVMCEGMGFVVLLGQFPEVAVDVVGVATFGF